MLLIAVNKTENHDKEVLKPSKEGVTAVNNLI